MPEPNSDSSSLQSTLMLSSSTLMHENEESADEESVDEESIVADESTDAPSNKLSYVCLMFCSSVYGVIRFVKFQSVWAA